MRQAIGFSIRDNRTGEVYDSNSDLSELALRLRRDNKECNLIYCDMETLAVGWDGTLYVIDQCGNVSYLNPNDFALCCAVIVTNPQSEGGDTDDSH